MNAHAVTFAALALSAALASAAAAAPRAQFASDMDYLRASRCAGIAEGVGVEGKALAAYLKDQGVGRAGYIIERGDAERTRAKRQAKGLAKAQLEAEYAGACGVFTAPPAAVAAKVAGEKG